MSTLTQLDDAPLESTSPAQRLRRSTAAVRVHFTWWGIRKTLTHEQKEEAGETYGADARLLSASKKIIDNKHEAYRKLTSIRSQVVSYWRSLTLPYVEAGVRLIRQSEIEKFVQEMEGHRRALTQAEAELNAVFDQIKADARRRLGRLHNPADYPEEVHGLFDVQSDFPSVEPPDYLLHLHPEIYRQEQERVARRFEQAVQLAEQAFVSEFAKLVSHLAERLRPDDGGQRKIFRDSAVSNIGEFFDRFRHLSVRSNQDLDRLVDEAQGLVQGLRPQELRDDEGLRQHVATRMVEVQEQLEGMIVEQPRRQIIRSSLSRNGDNHAAVR